MSHLMAGLVFGIRVLDPATYVSVIVTILGASFIACYVTARQILTVDPAATLRVE
jgi:hypothetical protein